MADVNDENNQVLLKPLTGWRIHSVASTFLIVGLDYANDADGLEKGLNHTLPIVIDPAMALAFADALRDNANRLLEEARAEAAVRDQGEN